MEYEILKFCKTPRSPKELAEKFGGGARLLNCIVKMQRDKKVVLVDGKVWSGE